MIVGLKGHSVGIVVGRSSLFIWYSSSANLVLLLIFGLYTTGPTQSVGRAVREVKVRHDWPGTHRPEFGTMARIA